MYKSAKEAMEKDPIIQEIDAHIGANNLEPLEKLILRVLKYNRADLLPTVSQSRACKENPSLIWLLKNKTAATFSQLFLIYGLVYFFFRVIETMTGLGGVLKLLTP